jgi:hypothetical protein
VPTGELLPANPDILYGVEDLIQLSYLNEPSVLYNLRCRYSQDKIYVSMIWSSCSCLRVRVISPFSLSFDGFYVFFL